MLLAITSFALVYSIVVYGGEEETNPPSCRRTVSRPESSTPIESGCTKIECPNILFQELKEIGSWEHLCHNLGVSRAVLDSLTYDRSDNDNKKRRCLKAFYDKNVDPGVRVCWETVVQAVKAYPISNLRIAKDIAEKYNIRTDP